MRKNRKIPKPAELPTLDEIALATGTDKASDGHGYTRHYDVLFSGLRDKDIKLLEIGIQDGKSLQMWERYFPMAKIVGLDVDQKCLALEHDKERTHLVCGSQSNVDCLDSIISQFGTFDVIIDDGSHKQSDQQRSFSFLFSYGLSPGGLYVIEDLNCSYENYWGGGLRDKRSTVEFIKNQIDELQCYMWGGTNPFQIDSVMWITDAVILRKKA